MLKRQPIREAQRGRVTTLIGENFSIASIEAEKSFIGLGPGLALTISGSGNFNRKDLCLDIFRIYINIDFGLELKFFEARQESLAGR